MKPADILLLYHVSARGDASTIREHVDAIAEHSSFAVTSVNTEFGFPPLLNAVRFQAIVLHWSLFGTRQYAIPDAFMDLIRTHEGAYKTAFFQDEHQHCQQRFAFINDEQLDCVWTLLDPTWWPEVYGRYTRVPVLQHTITGYVGAPLLRAAARFAKPDARRTRDVGYRGRRLPRWMGRGGQEKSEIGEEFLKRAASSGLRMDIRLDEAGRLYGAQWHAFLGDCRAVLGVESGVSIFDADGAVEQELERRRALGDFDEDAFVADVLEQREELIPYRVVSPRHFEAPAFRCCQVLFEGEYSGILRPLEHYIPLQKNYSNFEDVLGLLHNPRARADIVARAHHDLIASGEYSYGRFVARFDETLVAAGLRAMESSRTARHRTLQVQRERRNALRVATAAVALNKLYGRALDGDYPGRGIIAPLLRSAVSAARRLK